MSAAKNLVGLKVEGERKDRHWTVIEELSLSPGLSPGQFSVAYRVESSDGETAFMKASDLGMTGRTDDPMENLLRATTAYNFEKGILEYCKGNKLDKIVTALDAGSMSVVHEGVRDLVFFIIFELADGDLRKFITAEQSNNLIWVVSAAHNFAVAMNQLHSANVYHNDLKPANALVFQDTHKVADLGRATSPDFPVAHDLMLCAGDRRFAPPEQLYHDQNTAKHLERFLRAKAGDLYNLGSVIHFLITKRSLTPEIVGRLDLPFKPLGQQGGMADDYAAALPYWTASFGDVMTEFYDHLPDEWLESFGSELSEICDMVRHLCEPDYRMRGDLQASQVTYSKYSLSRTISRLDNIRNRLIVKSRAK